MAVKGFEHRRAGQLCAGQDRSLPAQGHGPLWPSGRGVLRSRAVCQPLDGELRLGGGVSAIRHGIHRRRSRRASAAEESLARTLPDTCGLLPKQARLGSTLGSSGCATHAGPMPHQGQHLPSRQQDLPHARPTGLQAHEHRPEPRRAHVLSSRGGSSGRVAAG